MSDSVDMEKLRSQLAKLAGISAGFHDIWGNYHQTPNETRDRILSALNMNADCPDELANIHRRVAEQHWHRPLPSVLVHRHQTMALSLTLVNLHKSDRHLIRISAEDGTWQEFEFAHSEIEIIDNNEIDGVSVEQVRLPIEPEPEPGYYRVELFLDRDAAPICSMSLVVAPTTCWWPQSDQQPVRCFGVSMQLYSLCSERNWGIGDFSDLKTSIEILAQYGVQTIGLNPLHAQLPGQPDKRSPYFPSSRFFLNPLYIDPTDLAEYLELSDAQQQDFTERAAQLRSTELIDYEAVAGLKFEALNACFEVFLRSGNSQRRQDLDSFERREGAKLEQFSRFESRDSDNPKYNALKSRYFQWCCDEQLRQCTQLARERGMVFGLYADIAVGTSAEGADAHNFPELYVEGIEIGAPPDDFSPHGQRWGLPPWSPLNMREDNYRSFIDLIRTTMRHAGVVRIDHVMGLMQQFWIPAGVECIDGAYVAYPLYDLLGIIALESQRFECAVVGEDLGTVPDQVREAVDDFDLLSTRLLYFEKDWQGDHRFLDPSDYPEKAIVTIGGHDLATLRGYWSGNDLEQLDQLGRLGDQQHADGRRRERQHDRQRLLDLLERNGFQTELDADNHELDDEQIHKLAEQIYCLLSQCPSRLILVQLTDIFGQLEQINIPGTVDEVPNWRYRMKPTLDAWSSHDGLRALTQSMRKQIEKRVI